MYPVNSIQFFWKWSTQYELRKNSESFMDLSF